MNNSLPPSSFSFSYASASPRFRSLLSGLALWLGVTQLLWAATATTTTITVSSGGGVVSTVPSHTLVTLTAAVIAGSTPLAAGQVNFCDAAAAYCEDIHILGTAQLTAAGKATLRFIPGPGAHAYKAVFAGTDAAATSSSPAASLTVTTERLLKTATTLASAGAAGSYTLTASVTGRGSVAPPTGEVYFLDRSNENAELGKATLPPGIPALALQATPVGTFRQTYPGEQLALADFNNDGKPDLATLTGDLPDVLRGHGDGTFTEEPANPKNTNYVPTVFTADFNNDGNADIIGTHTDNKSRVMSLTLYLGKGNGYFQTGVDLPQAVNCCYALAVGDFNHDGNADVLVYVEDSNNIKVLLGHGDGTFTNGWQNEPDAEKNIYIENLRVGDFNGDGQLDFAWISSTNYYGPWQFSAFINQGAGLFKQEDLPIATPYAYVAAAVADFNGDGRQDFLAADAYSANATMLFGNADGSFTQKLVSGFSKNLGYSMVVADFNGDGIADVFTETSTASPQEEVLLLGVGDGTFIQGGSAPASDLFIFVEPNGAQAADLDGDGIPDVAAIGGFSPGQYGSVLIRRSQTTTVSIASKAPAGPGDHEVVARYHGDVDFSTSVSAPVSLSAPSKSPVATLSTTTLQFSREQPLTIPSAAQTVTLTNTGTAALTIGGLAITPINGAGNSFASSSTCPASLAIGAACSIRVRFVPFSDGPKISQLVITDNAGNYPQAITLSGKSKGTPTVELSTAVLDFGSQKIGTRSDALTATVTNTGDAVLHLSSIALSTRADIAGSAPRSNFRLSNNCYGAVDAGKSCTIRVRFTPNGHSSGSISLGYVVLTDDAGIGEQYFAVQGEPVR